MQAAHNTTLQRNVKYYPSEQGTDLARRMAANNAIERHIKSEARFAREAQLTLWLALILATAFLARCVPGMVQAAIR